LIVLKEDAANCRRPVKGTRLPVSILFEHLEAGANVDNFLEWYEGVTREQVLDVLKPAVWTFREGKIWGNSKIFFGRNFLLVSKDRCV